MRCRRDRHRRRNAGPQLVVFKVVIDKAMLDSVRKWLAVRSYAKGLGAELKKRYGKQKHYTAAQVKRTAEQGRYNIDYLCYALCMYCSPGEFADYHRVTGEDCGYAK